MVTALAIGELILVASIVIAGTFALLADWNLVLRPALDELASTINLWRYNREHAQLVKKYYNQETQTISDNPTDSVPVYMNVETLTQDGQGGATFTLHGIALPVTLRQYCVDVLVNLGLVATTLTELTTSFALKNILQLVETKLGYQSREITDEILDSEYALENLVDDTLYIDEAVMEKFFEAIRELGYYDLTSSIGHGDEGKVIQTIAGVLTAIYATNGYLGTVNIPSNAAVTSNISGGIARDVDLYMIASDGVYDNLLETMTTQKTDLRTLLENGHVVEYTTPYGIFTAAGTLLTMYNGAENVGIALKQAGSSASALYTNLARYILICDEYAQDGVIDSTIQPVLYWSHSGASQITGGAPDGDVLVISKAFFTALFIQTTLAYYSNLADLMTDVNEESTERAVNSAGQTMNPIARNEALVPEAPSVGDTLIDVFPWLQTNLRNLIDSIPETLIDPAAVGTQYPAKPIARDDTEVVVPSDIATKIQNPAIDLDDAEDIAATDTIARTQTKVREDDRPVPPDNGIMPPLVIPSGDYAMFAIYNPTKTQLHEFSAWLWGSSASSILDQVGKLFSNPINSIISLHKVYCNAGGSGSYEIKLGYNSTGVTGVKKVDNPIRKIDMGTISIPEYYGDFTDYAPYASLKIYLPFIGIMSLDINEFLGGQMNVEYIVNVSTGACIANIYAIRSGLKAQLYSFSGNCMVPLPISSSNLLQNVASGMIGGAMSGAMIGGGVGAAIGAVAGGGLNGALQDNVSHSGQLGASCGELGYKKPYVIITRKVQREAYQFNQFYGKATNSTRYLNEVSGYTRVKSIHLEGINATKEELDKIESLLKEGVIL